MTYHFLAARMQIGKISVYEMLRLLEYNGFVKTEYQQDDSHRGPGRPSVYFSPTKNAFDFTQRMAVAPSELEFWYQRKEILLDQLRKKDPVVNAALREQLLSRINERKSPLLHITEMVTILLLTLSGIPSSERIQTLRKKILRIGYPGEVSLYTLFGVALAVSSMNLEDNRVTEELFNNISRYEYYLQDMHIENHQRICGYIRESARIINNHQ